LPDLVDFGRALRASLQSEKECPQSLPIKVQFVPAGRIANRFWYLPQHCCSCKAVCEPWKGRCPVCQSSDPPLPPRKRHLRGDRPYWPLVRFLGSEGANNLVKKYTRGKSL
ncbi:MAG: hypothetical protein P8M80_00625, partial [Pirellulaceae bacterium]|nr:hypothetical protein [Pirellulaceae bacterium]